MRTLSLYLLAANLLAGCSNEPEYSDRQRECIAKLYGSYDPKQMSQCVNACEILSGRHHRNLHDVMQSEGRSLASLRAIGADRSQPPEFGTVP